MIHLLRENIFIETSRKQMIECIYIEMITPFSLQFPQFFRRSGRRRIYSGIKFELLVIMLGTVFLHQSGSPEKPTTVTPVSQPQPANAPRSIVQNKRR